MSKRKFDESKVNRDKYGRFAKKIDEIIESGEELPLLEDGCLDIGKLLLWANNHKDGVPFKKKDFWVFIQESMRRKSSGRAHSPIDWVYTANHLVVYETDSNEILCTLDVELYEKHLQGIRKGIEKWGRN